ncbi:hypothetical protein [Actinomadura decatromicini]|uniref:Uncharacterized protein n=1 Tax=Actinomadura decatromicini TaxID=2604572 RepID=A0A5D3FTN7_9ACTN|nr:hypothetical protein [Actinomadura decatromicini]TYK51432.1 hypothetical protein FXF68_13595 [Actinomadura decatromicini]
MSDELVVLARGTMTPGPGGPNLRLSADHVSMSRDDAGAVRASRRSSEVGGDPAMDAVRGLLAAAASALGRAPVQSVLAEVRELPGRGWRQLRVLARVETSLGPLFTGLAAPGASRAPDVSSGLDVPPYGLRPGKPPHGWRALPLVMRPAVAAIPAAGTALLLASRTARARTDRLDGRRLLGTLSLTDLPAAHPPATSDDAGHPADAIRLVEAGVLVPLRIEATSGAPRGRAVWDHDRQALYPAPQSRLRLSAARAPAPGPALELRWPIESLRRYDPDGLLSLICVAHASDQPDRCFAVRLRGRPQTLLRAVRGAVADTSAVACADAHVTTPPLLLPNARELEAKGRCAVDTL